ncbi:MAG: glycosyl transferase [Cytophagaceae bacterium]|jgi:glycosyltransferase involved in cell wall biosynthesis|nr:glycosyl transferase [Cytophagaceae bacterium]
MQGGKRILGTATQKQSPVVSVITIVYNGGDLLEGTIQSVLKQDASHLEYIIIDGGSKDQTLDIIKKYSDQIDYWISEPDKGIYDAMNKGLKASTGEYVWFMNAGDHIHGDDVLTAIFAKEKDADVYYGEANFVKENRELIGTRSEISTRKLPEALNWKNMMYGMVVCHQSFIARRSLANAYDTSYRCSADINWVIEVLKKSKKTVHTHRILSDYLVGGFSMKQQKLAWKERFQIYTHHYGLLKNLWATSYIVVRHAMHKLSGKGNY